MGRNTRASSRFKFFGAGGDQMELSKVCSDSSQRIKSQINSKCQGFALVSLLALLPLFLTVLIALGAALFIFKKKSLAQAICVQQAARLQSDLSQTLEKLLRLNPRATSLRSQREL